MTSKSLNAEWATFHLDKPQTHLFVKRSRRQIHHAWRDSCLHTKGV